MNKEIIYKEILFKLQIILEKENSKETLMAVICNELNFSFVDFNWIGFYKNIDNNILQISTYIGFLPCFSINFKKGVCGKCARDKKVQIVKNVHNLDYHIFCNSSTMSEIVLPVFDKNKNLIYILDIDSNKENIFCEIDSFYLGKILEIFKN